ncbi:tryptophan halogenase family protein [Maricaulis sp.]|uniref:tryptophan halogenase family protein n=1 Tax=Maricaulis sp. TaxID=1486257 RepID=UPI00262112EE|nr:tryptophan halogenase family protein [Maricaulis sp.]
MSLKRVLVVGGGSAGWITAAYMDAALNSKDHKPVEVSLIESEIVGRIGVGEATVPTIRHVLQTIGISESDFMKATDATFKQSIRFDNWLDGRGETYYHPFERRQTARIDRTGVNWMASDRSRPFAELVSTQPHFCEAGLSPRMPKSPDYASPLPYAYHMDAEKFADHLCDIAKARGVKHYVDDVTDIKRAENGNIESVSTKGGLTLEADLFVDCTGFASILIGKTLGAEFDDFSQHLLCDSAVAMRVPYETYYPGQIKPYTTSTAVSNGWIWDIGLMNRRGTGYVYSSAFLDKDKAEAELRAFEGDHTKDLDARHLRFRVGRRPQQWVKNCVSIGLSSGFIEPLESTGIYLSEYAVVTLCEHFPYGSDMQPLADRFNQIMTGRYDEILDFINMHYCMTRRTDTEFWREVQKDERITDNLKAKFEFWKLKPPSHSDFEDQLRLFSHQSYEYILYGMDFQRDRFGGGQRPVAKHLPGVTRIVEAGKTRLPRHEDWLEHELGTKLGRYRTAELAE